MQLCEPGRRAYLVHDQQAAVLPNQGLGLLHVAFRKLDGAAYSLPAQSGPVSGGVSRDSQGRGKQRQSGPQSGRGKQRQSGPQSGRGKQR